MRLILVSSLLVSTALSAGWYYGRDFPNDWSQGGIWPFPAGIQFDEFSTVVPLTPGQVTVTGDGGCDIVQENVETYVGGWFFPFPVNATTTAPAYTLTVSFAAGCPTGYPQADMDESYNLTVTATGAALSAPEVWGVVRGLETFSHLIYLDPDDNTYKIKVVTVTDRPRFSYRGVLIDSSRHFISVTVLKRQLDIMAANKMNILHWHLTDSESFSYESAKFPDLTGKGAYSPRHFYKRADLQEIVDYARIRGIRVIPEFDTPGHTGAWRGQPGFLAQCYDADGTPNDLPNLVDPSIEANFQFLADFFEEVAQTFPEQVIHLGGDEVSGYVTSCWSRNPLIQAFMSQNGYATTTDLESYYFSRLESIIDNLSVKRQHIFWEEVLENNSPEPDAIIHIWEGNTFAEMEATIASATSKGHQVIVSSCWYLNYIKYGADWRDNIAANPETESRFYYCDPQNFDGTDEQKALVLGGIIGDWGEFMDNTNLEAWLWPRGSAVAERLWSQAVDTTDADTAWSRMHEFRCRMVARGYRFSPNNWPDFCPYELDD